MSGCHIRNRERSCSSHRLLPFLLSDLLFLSLAVLLLSRTRVIGFLRHYLVFSPSLSLANHPTGNDNMVAQREILVRYTSALSSVFVSSSF